MAGTNKQNAPEHILIVGATGGIGQALCRAIGSRWPEARRSAIARPGNPAFGNKALAEDWLALDLVRPETIAQAAASLSEPTAIDLVLIATGWLHDEALKPEKSLRQLSAAAFERSFAINASGVLLLLQALTSRLTRQGAVARERCRVLVLSAKVGSTSDNHLGGWYAYRMAKAALNMGVRNLGLEYARNHRKPLIAAVHPGTTHSRLSDPFSKRGLPVVSPDETAERLLQLSQTLDERHQGAFLHWDGTVIAY